jgi:hypothetical protein
MQRVELLERSSFLLGLETMFLRAEWAFFVNIKPGVNITQYYGIMLIVRMSGISQKREMLGVTGDHFPTQMSRGSHHCP